MTHVNSRLAKEGRKILLYTHGIRYFVYLSDAPRLWSTTYSEFNCRFSTKPLLVLSWLAAPFCGQDWFRNIVMNILPKKLFSDNVFLCSYYENVKKIVLLIQNISYAFLFSYISYAAAFVQKCHAYECDATVTFALQRSATVRKFHAYERLEVPNIRTFSAYEICWIHSILG